MTRPPALPPRVPGFRDASPASRSSLIEGSHPRSVRQLNVRVDAILLDRYRRLLRDCEDAGITIAMTEVVHALLHAGPTTPEELRTLVRAYRRAHDDL